MGWKTVVRQMERNARRQQRELEKRQKQFAKMEEQQRAQYEVDLHNNQIDILVSIHKEHSPKMNWKNSGKSLPPTKPTKENKFEKLAQQALDKHKPGMLSAMFGGGKKKALEEDFNEAVIRDQKIFEKELRQWEEETDEWKELQQLSNGVLSGNCDSKLKALDLLDPFSEISELGSNINYEYIQKKYLNLNFSVHGISIIPQEDKTLLKSGKLSVKKMTSSKFNELYQDYVCSCILRIASDVFALLPEEIVYITAHDEILNTSTGHMEDSPIVSVCIPRKTLMSMKLDAIDPSDSFGNFVHNMNFKKTKGFNSIKKLDLLNEHS